MNRAIRRHHAARMLAKVAGHRITPPERARHWRDNATKCSCYMCGNPRRHWHEVTRHEVIAARDFEEQMKEWEITND